MKFIIPNSIRNQFKTLVLITLLLATAQGCTSSPPPAEFSAPDIAVDNLIAALRSGDPKRVEVIFGAKTKELATSGDQKIDREDINTFLAKYDVKHRLRTEEDGSMTLIVGEQDWPFPVPLVQLDKGWTFDTDAGIEEIVNRRVGRNERNAVQVCLAVADAQREYMISDPDNDGRAEYAQKIFSDPGKRNGLFWETGPDEPESPLGPLIATARSEGYTQQAVPQAYHGYVFHILKSQGQHASAGAIDYVIGGRMIGGFAVIAFPAEYGTSGVMTFIVNQERVVYQKDLGAGSTRAGVNMTSYDPGPGWQKVAADAPAP